MARKKCFASLFSFFFVLLGKTGGSFSRPPDASSTWDIDFNTLLDSYLGATPAVWLTSQSIVVELKARKDRDYGLRPVGKDMDGEEAGSYLASLLVPPSNSNNVTHGHKTNNPGLAGDICRSLVNLPKATGKPMIDLETLRNRVLKSIVGNGFVMESARNLCKNLVPGIEATWVYNKCPWYDARLKMAMDSGFQKVLSAHLTDLGIDEARALRFAGELEATLRLVDSTSSLEGSFEHLMRELLGNISTLVLRGVTKQSAVASLKEFTKLSDNAARRLPQGPIPVGTSQLRDSDDPVCIIGTFTEIAMSSLRIAADLGGRMEVAADSATSVMDHLHAATLICRAESLETRNLGNVELRDESTTELRNVARAMRELVDKLPPINLPRSYNWPDTGVCDFPQAHPRTIRGNFANEPTIASSDNLSPSSTATMLFRHKRQHSENRTDPRETPATETSLSHDSDLHPAAGYVITLRPDNAAYYRVPEHVSNRRASRKVPECTAPAAATVTSTRTVIRNFPRYTSTATISYTTTSTAKISYTTTSTVTSTYTDYECKHGTVKRCHNQYIRLCWYNMLV